jgi:hypothetical protein
MWSTSSLDIPVTPSAYELEAISLSIVVEAPFSLLQTTEQVVGSDMWALNLQFPTIVDPKTAGEVSAFQARLNGSVNTFKFVIPERDLDYEGDNVARVVSTNGANGSNVSIQRLTSPGVQAILNVGTYIRIRDQLHKILRRSGTGNIQNFDIFPGIRYEGTLLNEPVFYKAGEVYGVFRSKRSTSTHNFFNNHTYNFSINAVESNMI